MADSARVLVLAPDAVWDGTSDAPQRGWVVLVRGQTDRGGRARGQGGGARRRRADRARRDDAHPRPDRGPLASLPAPVQRDAVGRSGAAGAARRCGSRARWCTPRDAARRLHHRCATSAPRARLRRRRLQRAIEQGIIPGPRLLVVTRAIVATAATGRAASRPSSSLPQGAEEADGEDASPGSFATRSVAAPTGSRSTPTTAGDPAASFGRPSAGGARTLVEIARGVGPAGRRARDDSRKGCGAPCSPGVETIEHGDAGTPEVFRLMRQRGVALCPTIAAGEADRRTRRMGKAGRSGAGRDRREARELPRGARRRRDDLLRQRRRRVPPWREWPRARD